MRGVRFAGAVVLAAFGLLAAPSAAAGDVAVTDVRHWSYEGYTRVVVELSRPVATELRRLPADREAGRLDRLYLDLPGVRLDGGYDEPIPVVDGLLRSIRLGQNAPARARLVIDLDRYDRHRLLVLTQPDRIVVDVYGDAPHGTAARREHGAARAPLELRPVRTVVIDPGHGGRDPGAIGVGRLREKDVTLRLARELRPHLEARGLRVVLTRESDVWLSLEERTALAEGVGGDLFVSLHANAAPRRGAKGIETYYLDESHQRHTLRVAAHENRVTPARLDVLQRTLAHLRVSEVGEHSAQLARDVHGQMIEGLKREYRGVEDLGVKPGPFYVLFLSSMPAILVEAGFLTNRDDARRLRDDGYLESLAERLARGVSRYRGRRELLLAGGAQ